MTGAVMGLIGALKAAAPPPANFFRCTSFQISIGCCTNTNQCGTLGIGVSCSPATSPDPFIPANCE